jgi:pSer/pThr/pTyr-binding forkhead associated (FHA) protein
LPIKYIDDYTSIGIPEQQDQTGGLFVLSQDEVDIISKLEPNAALLVEHKEGLVEARYLLNTDTTLIGRNESADILLDDNTISRKHAEILRNADVWTLKDLGSLNGTYVNGERIEEHCTINSGDEIQIGKFQLVFFANRKDK